MTRKQLLFVILGLSFIATSLFAQRSSRRGGGRSSASGFLNCVTLPVQDVDEHETEALLFMLEEEKLARDVYLAMAEKWNLSIFSNIASSESRHMLTLIQILDKYTIEHSAEDLPVGEFYNQDLQTLYNDLIAKGNENLISALFVGATIEDVDIYDLQKHLEETDNEDITCVFQNLIKGSENHMRAFVGFLETNGETYEAQFITQEELEQILSSESTVGSGQRGGRKGGRGRR